MKATKHDKDVLRILSSLTTSDRKILLNTFSPASRARIETLCKHLFRGKGRYRLPEDLRETLSKTLQPHRKKVHAFIENTAQRGGASFNGWLVSTVIPIISELAADIIEEEREQKGTK